jgi:hypothetical protein
MKRTILMAAAVAVSLLTTAAQATVFNFTASLNGANEVPPNGSPGTGAGSFTFDDTTNILTVAASFSGLTSNANNAHIHIGPAGVAGPVVFFTPFTPSTSGTVNGSGALNATQITALFTGGLYLNIHSVNFPGGEIRGQLILVPTPASLALLGLAGLVGPRRRRA